MARLLGCRYGQTVVRYEKFRRTPSLKTAIAYEVVFNAHLQKLFGDLYAQVQESVRARAGVLLSEIERRRLPRNGTVDFLRDLAAVPTVKRPTR